MTFSVKDLLQAANAYQCQDDSVEGIYPKLVWSKRTHDPDARLGEALSFLGSWRALRFKGGGLLLREIYPDWVQKFRPAFGALKGKPFHALNQDDLYLVLCLSTGLRERGIPSTAFGKLLHFLLPETLLLWDGEVVRRRYGLRDDPASYIAYQCFGQRLLQKISGSNLVETIAQIEKDHSKHAGYHEPITRILDHLAYRPQLAKSAVETLGGYVNAFSLKMLSE